MSFSEKELARGVPRREEEDPCSEKHRRENTPSRFRRLGRRGILARTLRRGGQKEKELLLARFAILAVMPAERDY